MNIYLMFFLCINTIIRPIISSLSIIKEEQCLAFDEDLDLDKETFGPYYKQSNYRYYLASYELKEIYNPFEKEYGLSIPTIIDIFDETGEIGICVEYGIYGDGYFDVENIEEDFTYSSDGMQYVYVGHLMNCFGNVYAVKGKWIKELSDLENKREGNYDFYIIFQSDKLYVTFNDICK